MTAASNPTPPISEEEYTAAAKFLAAAGCTEANIDRMLEACSDEAIRVLAEAKDDDLAVLEGLCAPEGVTR